MKKFLVLFLSIVIVISLVACAKQPADEPMPTCDDTTVAATTTAVATKKEGTPQKPLGDSYSYDGGEPPIMVVFDSVQDIPRFIDAANGTEAEFEKYAEQEDLYYAINQKVAQIIAHNMEIVYLPITSSKISDGDFGATYNVSSNTLDIIYRIDGGRYRFVFWFNKNDVPEITKLPVYEENVKLGEILFTLYEGEECLFGYFLDDSVRAELIIYTDNFEKVSLDAFDMVPVASVK